jgi:nicotinamide riboside kinase
MYVFYMRVAVAIMSLLFRHPFTALVAGPTSSGKSTLIRRFIQELPTLVTTQIVEVIYCLPSGQPIMHDFPTNVKFHEGIPDFEQFSDCKPRLLILDDLQSSARQDIAEVYTRKSHHYNISVCISHRFFSSSKPF